MTGILKTDGIWVDAANIKSPQFRIGTTAKKVHEIYCSFYGPEVGTYAVSVEIDGTPITNLTVNVGDKRIGKDKFSFFVYPEEKKSVGVHKVVYKTGYRTELPDGKVETKYLWTSPEFEIIIE